MLEARRLKKKAEKDGMSPYLLRPYILPWLDTYLPNSVLERWAVKYVVWLGDWERVGGRLNMTGDDRNHWL